MPYFYPVSGLKPNLDKTVTNPSLKAGVSLSAHTICLPIQSVCPYSLSAHTVCLPIQSVCPYSLSAHTHLITPALRLGLVGHVIPGFSPDGTVTLSCSCYLLSIPT